MQLPSNSNSTGCCVLFDAVTQNSNSAVLLCYCVNVVIVIVPAGVYCVNAVA